MDEVLKQKLTDYRPSDQTVELIKATRILLLVGPTGAGKDSLKNKLLETGWYHHIVSHTTRPPRINHGVLETDGKDYHFINLDQARKMIDDQAFVEVKMYSDNVYGTAASEIRIACQDNKIAVTDVEVKGVNEYKVLDKNVMAVFLLPPDFQTWRERLNRRYGDVVDADDMLRRMHTALDEIEQLLSTDNYSAIINDDIDATFDAVRMLVADGHVHPEIDAAARGVAQDLARDIKDYIADYSQEQPN